MKINITGMQVFAQEYETVEINGYIFYWKGLIWKYGKKAGKETIVDIAPKLIRNPAINYKELFGAYTVIMQSPDGKICIFCDNSDMNGLWMGREWISDNFLELIREENVHVFDLDAVTEFLILGSVYFDKTLVQGIQWCDNKSMYMIQNGELRIVSKAVGKIDDETSISSYEEFFKQLAYSLKGEKVTLSLTGGYDSRMVLAGINKYIDVNIFISGDNEKDKDIICAKKAAKALKKELEIVKIQKPVITENYLWQEFEAGQGCIIGGTTGRSRINAFHQNRKKAGYKYHLTGDAGTMHKDWYWVQDLPFYNKRNVNIKNYYKQRVVLMEENLPLGEEFCKRKIHMEHEFIKKLESEKRDTNSQSYDAFTYNITTQTHYKLNYTIDSMYSYAPLRELELVKLSYHLPRRERFFYNRMRKVTTHCSPKLARVVTYYGTTASSELRYLLRDVIFQCIDYAKKGCRLLGRRVFKKSFFTGNVSTWSIEDDVRKLELSKRALEFGKKRGYIEENTTINTIPNSLLGRVTHLYLLDCYMNDDALKESGLVSERRHIVEEQR